MKTVEVGDTYFFVDESGDSAFYNAKGKCIVGEPGCSPILILGFIETQKPHEIRKAVLRAQQSIVTDPYLTDIRSISKTQIALHAKDDAPEVRYLFYKEIKSMPFNTQFVVARKVERIFKQDHQSDEAKFYDELIARLFQNVLHRFQHNHIVFSMRGSRERRAPLEEAIKKAKDRFEQKHKVKVDTATFDVQPPNPKRGTLPECH